MDCNKETIPKDSRYRVTPQRKLVLQVLRSVESHPTAQELYEIVHKKDPRINLTSIYRTLDFLEKQNLVMRLHSKNKETRYDGNVQKHCHLCCIKCGSIQEIFDLKDIEIDSKQLKDSGFDVHGDCLELHGLCKKCQS